MARTTSAPAHTYTRGMEDGDMARNLTAAWLADPIVDHRGVVAGVRH